MSSSLDVTASSLPSKSVEKMARSGSVLGSPFYQSCQVVHAAFLHVAFRRVLQNEVWGFVRMTELSNPSIIIGVEESDIKALKRMFRRARRVPIPNPTHLHALYLAAGL